LRWSPRPPMLSETGVAGVFSQNGSCLELRIALVKLPTTRRHDHGGRVKRILFDIALGSAPCPRAHVCRLVVGGSGFNRHWKNSPVVHRMHTCSGEQSILLSALNRMRVHPVRSPHLPFLRVVETVCESSADHVCGSNVQRPKRLPPLTEHP
jgi:hypothetical protein